MTDDKVPLDRGCGCRYAWFHELQVLTQPCDSHHAAEEESGGLRDGLRRAELMTHWRSTS